MENVQWIYEQKHKSFKVNPTNWVIASYGVFALIAEPFPEKIEYEFCMIKIKLITKYKCYLIRHL